MMKFLYIFNYSDNHIGVFLSNHTRGTTATPVLWYAAGSLGRWTFNSPENGYAAPSGISSVAVPYSFMKGREE